MDNITQRINELAEWMKAQTPGKIEVAQSEALRNLVSLSQQISQLLKNKENSNLIGIQGISYATRNKSISLVQERFSDLRCR